MRDRSLDEFLDADTDGAPDEEGEETGNGTESDDAPAGPDVGDDFSGEEAGERGGEVPDDGTVEPAIRRIAPDPAPARSTYAFSPGGAACAACGARVERRWRDEEAGGLVCGDCKEW